MARVKYVEREELDSEGQGAYDGIAGSRGAVNNNFQALLNSPAAAARMADFGAYIRFETPLPARIRSLAVLTMTRETDGEYVWTVNEEEPWSRDWNPRILIRSATGKRLKVWLMQMRRSCGLPKSTYASTRYPTARIRRCNR